MLPVRLVQVMVWDQVRSPDVHLWDRAAETWLPRTLAVKGWVKDWAKKEMTGRDDERVTKLLTEVESTLPREVKEFTDRTDTKNHQYTWADTSVVYVAREEGSDDRGIENMNKRPRGQRFF